MNDVGYQSRNGEASDVGREAPCLPQRRNYTSPRMVEYGALTSLTRGGFAGIEDFGFTGTTQTIITPPPPPEEI